MTRRAAQISEHVARAGEHGGILKRHDGEFLENVIRFVWIRHQMQQVAQQTFTVLQNNVRCIGHIARASG